MTNFAINKPLQGRANFAGNGFKGQPAAAGNAQLFKARAQTAALSYAPPGYYGNQTQIGTQYGDYLLGGYGNDTIHGRGGNDHINGGNGNDTIHGGRGNDVLIGGNGNDTIKGGRGSDLILSGRGVDTAVFDGNYADYRITHGPGGVTYVCDACGNVDTLKGVENLQFRDTTIRLPGGDVTIQPYPLPIQPRPLPQPLPLPIGPGFGPKPFPIAPGPRPIAPTFPTQPIGPVGPTQPGAPAQPGKPAQPGQPGQPGAEKPKGILGNILDSVVGDFFRCVKTFVAAPFKIADGIFGTLTGKYSFNQGLDKVGHAIADCFVDIPRYLLNAVTSPLGLKLGSKLLNPVVDGAFPLAKQDPRPQY